MMASSRQNIRPADRKSTMTEHCTITTTNNTQTTDKKTAITLVTMSTFVQKIYIVFFEFFPTHIPENLYRIFEVFATLFHFVQFFPTLFP